MNRVKTLALIGIVVALAWAAGIVMAQDPGSPGSATASQGTGSPAEPIAEAAPEGTVASEISYQGRLVDPRTGDPISGNYDLEFTFWSLAEGGSQVGSSTSRLDQIIVNGLYRTTLRVDTGVVTGQELWIEIKVRIAGTPTWYTLIPRVQVLPTVYALTLRPGARIVGSISRPNALVMATNTSHGFGLRGESQDPGGFGILGYQGSTDAWAYGAGIKGSVLASGYGVVGSSDSGNGTGVAGFSTTGNAVAGYDGGSDAVEAHGYGGYFSSTDGIGVLGRSWATARWNNLYTPGVYGLSANGVGVLGRSDSDAVGTRHAGVLGWGDQGPGGTFIGSGPDLLTVVEDLYADGLSLQTRFRITDAGEVYADGGYHCGKAAGCWTTNDPASMAEMLPAAGGPVPGDVLVVGADGRLAASTAPFERTVVGVYAAAPAQVGSAAHLDQDGYAALALVGVVRVKASAENGAIVPGDLLVASATPGHCMRAGDDPPPGTVIGKALEGLDAGTGLIRMLVMMQ